MRQVHSMPRLAGSSLLPVLVEGGQRTRQNVLLVPPLPAPSPLPEAAFLGWQSRAGVQGGLCGEGGACRAGADTSDKSNLFPRRRLDGN